ncbi:hypothetical protein T261_02465 [Streptomyces lydicus]|nr:hypothetical protein T261_02465 [Streptomyces lydicus]
MPPRIDVAAATREIVLFDRLHDRDAHPCGRTDRFHGQSCFATGLLEGSTDGRPVVVTDGRPVVFGGVADGHGGAFRACSHLLEVQSRGGAKGSGKRESGVCTPSERPRTGMDAAGGRGDEPSSRTSLNLTYQQEKRLLSLTYE